MKKDVKKISAVALGVGIIAGTLLGAVAFNPVQEVPVEKIVYENVTIDLTQAQRELAFKAGVDSVDVPEDLSEALADEKVTSADAIDKLHSAVDFIEDNVDEDADLDYVLFEADARVEAEALIHNDFKELLDEEGFFDKRGALDNYRFSEVSIKEIEDAVVIDRDFEDKDLELSYEVKVKAKEDGEDREYFTFEFVIPFDNGELDKEGIQVSLI